jgi:co-chaperonin GroES (HSP10)
MLKPMQDFMILKLWEKVGKSIIELPQMYEKEKSKSAIFEVVEVGDGYLNDYGTLIKTIIKKGDKVIVGAYVLTDFEVDKQKVYVARERDVVLKVE